MDEVQIKHDKKKERYTPIKVRRIKRKDKEYVPIKLDGKYQFALVMSEGYVSHYQYVNPESDGYEDFALTVLVKNHGTTQQISNLFFLKAVKEFLYDCEPLMEKIDTKEFGAKDLDKILQYYNLWIESNGQSVKAKKEPENLDLVVALMNLIEKVQEDQQLSKDDELMEMLIDVKSKLTEGKAIPKYLSGAIQEALKSNEGLYNLFTELVVSE